MKKSTGEATVANGKSHSNNSRTGQQTSRQRNKTLPEKEFRVRDSLLTEMLSNNPEIRAVHNVILTVFIHFVAYSAVSDLVVHGSIDLGFANMRKMFGKPILTLSIIASLHLMPILVLYPIFRFWAFLRDQVISNSLRNVLDTCLIGSVGLIVTAIFYIPFEIHFVQERIPLACSAAIVMEQIRITMKVYAFVRTNFPRVLIGSHGVNKKLDKTVTIKSSGRNNVMPTKGDSGQVRQRGSALVSHEESESESQLMFTDEDGNRFKSFDDDAPCPSLQKLVYFLYAPTLIYRDNYPRSSSRRWSFIFWHTIHAIGSILFYSLIQNRIGYVVLQDFGPKNRMTPGEILTAFSYQIVVGSVGYVIAWLTLLHSIQNVFGELLRFGDRGFYKDWWNAVSMAQYHRTWNTPVQDFLYNYVYKEAWQYGLGDKISWLPALLVFSLSNFFHEYAISFATQFFCPVMGLMFAGPGTFLTFIPNKKFPQLGNIFMHWSMGLGHAFIHMFYTMEHFSRVNHCPPAETPLKDFFIPRFISCDAIQWS